MIPKPKQTSSKLSFRWPWPKKRKGHLTVDQHPDLEDEVPTEQIESEESNAGRIQSTPTEYVQAASQVVVASNTAMASVSDERRATEVTSGGTSSSVGGLRITQTTMSNAEAVSSFLPNASGCVFNSLQINAHQHELASNSNDPSGWERLLQNTAPNALHDSECRFDPPKCDEDTRVDAIEELMGWIQDRESPQRLLCMTGAAGSGKSALQQTIAEKCSRLGILASTFCFSASDPTRNTVSAVIPTIAYQFGSNNRALRGAISEAVTQDPLIFRKTLRTQMHRLIISPFEEFSRATPQPDLAPLPYAILIDGLDECVDEHRQAELLETIDECLLQNEAIPFRVFIASRPEWAIRSALEDTGHLHQKAYHIQLSDQYDATDDIRRVLWRRLRDIGRRSGDPRTRSPSWPSEEDIETLVANASGQFIYAATVIKFVSERRSSPVDRLRAVITWTPEDRAHPFAALDLLYTNIVSAAKEGYEAAYPERDFLLLLRVYQFYANGLWTGYGILPVTDLDELLDLGDDAHRWLISDLRSLATVVRFSTPLSAGSGHLVFYHKSFQDFLDSASRSRILFVPESRAAGFVTASCITALDRADAGKGSSSMDINWLICELLLPPLSRPEPGALPRDSVSPILAQLTARWETVEKCVSGYFDLYQSFKETPGGPPYFPKTISNGWLAFLSHALLEYENHDQENYRRIQILRNKWEQISKSRDEEELAFIRSIEADGAPLEIS